MPHAARVLIVDDEPGVRRILTRWLLTWGYDAAAAASALDALEMMETDPRDILLSDIEMPHHDGFWLAERVRVQWPQVAIVMITAHDDAQIVQQSRRLGAVDFVRKPFDVALLRQAIDRASGSAQFRPSARRD
jgi:CheY-like chemotaxis protein